MKYLKQFTIILGICLLGELVRFLLPFLVINFVGLLTTFVVTGRVTQFLLKREKEGKK